MAKGRRGNNEGTVLKRDDGRWEAKVSLPNGTRKSFYGKTREEVRRKMQDAIYDAQKGIMPADGRQTVEQYINYWLDVRGQTKKIGPSTVRIYYFRTRHLIRYLGKVAMSKVTAQQVQHMYLELLKEGQSSSTVFNLHNIMRASFKDAVRLGIISRSVIDAVESPREDTQEMQVLTPEQVQFFLKGIEGDRYEAVYLLALSTGMRAGEVFGLEWRDVDFERHAVTVRVGWHHEMQGYAISLPKTARSRRTIALTSKVIDALLRHRELQETEKEKMGSRWQRKYDLIFPSSVGGRAMFEKFCLLHFHPLMRSLGLPEIRFHDLRHTAATLLLSRGVNIKVVSEMLGHANVTTTLRTYAHILPHMQDHAAKVMEDILGDE